MFHQRSYLLSSLMSHFLLPWLISRTSENLKKKCNPQPISFLPGTVSNGLQRSTRWCGGRSCGRVLSRPDDSTHPSPAPAAWRSGRPRCHYPSRRIRLRYPPRWHHPHPSLSPWGGRCRGRRRSGTSGSPQSLWPQWVWVGGRTLMLRFCESGSRGPGWRPWPEMDSGCPGGWRWVGVWWRQRGRWSLRRIGGPAAVEDFLWRQMAGWSGRAQRTRHLPSPCGNREQTVWDTWPRYNRRYSICTAVTDLLWAAKYVSTVSPNTD